MLCTGVADAWTTRRVLAWTAQDFERRGIGSPRLDAELLIAHALGLTRVQVYLDLDRPLSPDELSAIRALVARRREREPVAYILGHRDFWRHRFEVGPDVLVPRPDTETLVERALARLPPEEPRRVLDLCTGSGCVAISIALDRPLVTCAATDLSAAALSVARRNAAALGVTDRVSFHEGDLFAAVSGEPFDVVVANPPYVPAADHVGLMPEVARYEPELALVAGVDGLDVHRRIAAEVAMRLVSGGSLLVEIGAGQADAAASLYGAVGDVTLHEDLARIPRVVEVTRP